MTDMASSGEKIPGSLVVGAALVGVVTGLLGTALMLGSFEFGIFGGIAGGVGTAIMALSRLERADG